MAYERIKRYAIGRGMDPKHRDLVGIDYDPWTPGRPITIWAGGNFDSRDAASIPVLEIERFNWAIECTKTKWFYNLLKQLPPEQPLTYKIVNAEYVKHHGKDMELSLD